MIRLRQRLVYAAFFCAFLSLSIPVQADSGEPLIVSPEGPYLSIDEALAVAQDGDVIEVHGGIYPAPLVVETGVSLIGIDNPIIDGNGEGTLVFINAPDVRFQGFTLRNSGSNLHDEDSGIVVQAPRVTIEDNLLEDVLFGIYLANASDGIVRNNTIIGREVDLPLRGDGIRIWYSNNTLLSGNEVTNTRDTLIWFADGITIEGNHLFNNRYGIHFMYSSNAQMRRNVFEGNSVGVFMMHSTGLTAVENLFIDNRGPSGYGIALKDMDEVIVEDNISINNRVGLYVDNSPSAFDGHNFFTGNVFGYNNIGVMTLPAVERNVFQSNTFLENGQQVSTRGRGTMQGNIWMTDGLGNYWSDYVGYDENRDGVGELPYRAENLFESLADQHPVLRLFTYSPASQAIDFAATAFPMLLPEPKLIDKAPMTHYVLPAILTTNEGTTSRPLFGAALVLIGLGAAPFIRRKFDSGMHRTGQSISFNQEANMIAVKNLTKQYDHFKALDDVSFKVQPGESVALWGTNGAGKTTALKCMLGLIPFEGVLKVNGIDIHHNSKAARAIIGYVPQETVFYDLTVRETLHFFAQLKKAPQDNIPVVLDYVQLSQQIDKPVNTLSGGMKQRLALAVALLSDPPVLVLDEPTANLDAKARYDFVHLVRSLKQSGKTIVFASHRLEEVESLAERVLVLEHGKLAFECHPGELSQKAGMQKWMRIRVATDQLESALRLLRNEGFAPRPNAHALYVDIHLKDKIMPLRILESAAINVEDFDLVDANALPSQDGIT